MKQVMCGCGCGASGQFPDDTIVVQATEESSDIIRLDGARARAQMPPKNLARLIDGHYLGALRADTFGGPIAYLAVESSSSTVALDPAAARMLGAVLIDWADEQELAS